MGKVLDALFPIAEGQDGFFTTRQASAEGISKQAIIAAERRGRVERRQRGVYRITQYPFNSSTAHYWDAVLWTQARAEIRAVLSHQTALLLHGLSDVNPAQVHVSVQRSVRIQRSVPQWLRLHRADVTERDIEYAEGLPVTSVSRTLSDLLDEPGGNSASLHDAIRDAGLKGIIVSPEILKRAGTSRR